MKMRTMKNSVRFRLTQQDVQTLCDVGSVEAFVAFGPSSTMGYALVTAAGITAMSAGFDGGRVTVTIPHAWAREICATDRVGFDGTQDVGGGQVLTILVEKDYRCLEPRPGEDDRGAFPNPQAER